jgi:hypothetical protein
MAGEQYIFKVMPKEKVGKFTVVVGLTEPRVDVARHYDIIFRVTMEEGG